MTTSNAVNPKRSLLALGLDIFPYRGCADPISFCWWRDLHPAFDNTLTTLGSIQWWHVEAVYNPCIEVYSKHMYQVLDNKQPQSFSSVIAILKLWVSDGLILVESIPYMLVITTTTLDKVLYPSPSHSHVGSALKIDFESSKLCSASLPLVCCCILALLSSESRRLNILSCGHGVHGTVTFVRKTYNRSY